MQDKIELSIGTRITCQTNNHFICEVIDTIRQGDSDYCKKIGNWQIPEPTKGSFPVCNICGSWFFDGSLFHIENKGWVSSRGTVKFVEEKRYVPEPRRPNYLLDKMLEILGI